MPEARLCRRQAFDIAKRDVFSVASETARTKSFHLDKSEAFAFGPGDGFFLKVVLKYLACESLRNASA